MHTLQVEIPVLRDPSLVAETILGAACRTILGSQLGHAGYAEANALLGFLARCIRQSRRPGPLSTTPEALAVAARACRNEARALELGRRSLRGVVPDNGAGEGELVLLTIALGCEAAAMRKSA